MIKVIKNNSSMFQLQYEKEEIIPIPSPESPICPGEKKLKIVNFKIFICTNCNDKETGTS